MPANIENIPCPHCREAVEYNPRHGGEPGKCPSCGATFVMPETELSTLFKIRDSLYVVRLTLVCLAIIIVYWLVTHW